MVCRTCQSPLRIIKGGEKVVDGKIIMVQVMGCLNPSCPDKMIEQGRKEIEVEQFTE